jgi:multidrug resistance efflux pump
MRHSIRNGAIVAIGAVFAGLTGCSDTSTHAASREPDRAPASQVTLACQGRVEGRTETVEVGAAADGVIQVEYVKEGQAVRKGAKLAEIGCPDLIASLAEARSEVESARQVRARLLRGSREEERRMATEQTRAARSELQRATLNLNRMKQLYAKTDVSKASLDDAQRDYEVAQAKVEEAARHEQLVNAPALAEDIAKADADITAAGDRVRVIEERIGKYTVTAPIDGTILRILLRPGESFSTMAPRPLFTMSDLSVRRVRAEIDERDVMKVRVGQPVEVFPDGREAQKFKGKVQQIASSMGRKRILSGDPAEKTDHDVLESMILLDESAARLPVGMRVVVQFLQ